VTDSSRSTKAIETVLKGEHFPRSFPSVKFASFYRQTAEIEADAVARLRQVPIPAGQQAHFGRGLRQVDTAYPDRWSAVSW
jgi:hypothetical protein